MWWASATDWWAPPDGSKDDRGRNRRRRPKLAGMPWVLAVVGLLAVVLAVLALRKPRVGASSAPAPPVVAKAPEPAPPQNQGWLKDPPPSEAPGWLRQAVTIGAPPPPLTALGPYTIEATLGSGAMGAVYKAHDPSTQRTVALKVANPLSDYRSRFEREIAIAKELVHPNLVETYFGGELDGHLCLAMEWVEGQTLESILRGGPLPLEDFPLLACQLASGLHFAHKKNVLHRDIKPANVMVMRDGTLKLLDFGLALAEGQERFTAVGFAMGTPTHMAPEGLTKGVSDEFTDQYALGVVFYQMLTGRCPFEGDNPMLVGQAQVKEAPPPMSMYRTGVPPEWEKVVLRMLSKKPEDRFDDLSQIRRFLTTALVEPT